MLQVLLNWTARQRKILRDLLLRRGHLIHLPGGMWVSSSATTLTGMGLPSARNYLLLSDVTYLELTGLLEPTRAVMGTFDRRRLTDLGWTKAREWLTKKQREGVPERRPLDYV